MYLLKEKYSTNVHNLYLGTGHGVGAYLNVHEGPMGISWYEILITFRITF